ncbi:hypothetical protein Hypma_003918, partial [Hypsizygus marmoreus]
MSQTNASTISSFIPTLDRRLTPIYVLTLSLRPLVSSHKRSISVFVSDEPAYADIDSLTDTSAFCPILMYSAPSTLPSTYHPPSRSYHEVPTELVPARREYIDFGVDTHHRALDIADETSYSRHQYSTVSIYFVLGSICVMANVGIMLLFLHALVILSSLDMILWVAHGKNLDTCNHCVVVYLVCNKFVFAVDKMHSRLRVNLRIFTRNY